MTGEDLTDEQIAERVKAGDKEIFGLFVERYEKKLLRYGKKFLARSEDIEDVVQDVFVKAYQHIQGFDSSLRFSPWIYRIAHNTFVNELRKSTRRPFLPFDFDELVSYQVYEDPAAAEREHADMLRILDTGLEQVQAKYKEILILYYLESLSYKEIADVLQIPIGTVGIRLKRAKDMLKKEVQI